MGRRDRLNDQAIDAALAELAWRRVDDHLEKTVKLATFPEAIAFVGRVADVAEGMDHHPDIDIRWRTVVLRVSTHSAGGLTQMDLDFARRVDDLGTG
jgi:4a-hydroxytetrahydrobiopterin dehydratase